MSLSIGIPSWWPKFFLLLVWPLKVEREVNIHLDNVVLLHTVLYLLSPRSIAIKPHPPPWCRRGQLCSPQGRWQGPPSYPRSSPPPSPSICRHCRRFSCWSHHKQWPRHGRRGSRVALRNTKLRQNVNCRESHLKVHIFPGQLCPWHYTGIRMQLTQIKLNSGNFHPAAQLTRHKHGWRMSYAAKMRTLIFELKLPYLQLHCGLLYCESFHVEINSYCCQGVTVENVINKSFHQRGLPTGLAKLIWNIISI